MITFLFYFEKKQRPPAVRIDGEGHLIYKTGDVLQERCELNFDCLCLWYIFNFLFR